MTQKARTVAPAEAAAEAAAPAASRPRGSRRHALRHKVAVYALVALGSMIGGVLRAIASLVIHAHTDPGFPWGTLFVNVTGSFAIGFYATLTGPEGRLLAGSRQRQFVMTGICGGYTTFSVFSLETFRLLQAGDLSSAGLNVGVSVVGWLAAVWLGHMLATGLNRLKGL
jgi:fluoride exporter